MHNISLTSGARAATGAFKKGGGFGGAAAAAGAAAAIETTVGDGGSAAGGEAAAAAAGEGGEAAPAAGEGGEEKEEDWEECDDGSGNKYFYNKVSGQSQWERPKFKTKLRMLMKMVGLPHVAEWGGG